ncbi:MAG: hypothetical protein BGO67_05775 [Alphaproteobacteria bacterium 41-28]|nr:MAG: hypothetical protein BGO67_05775 [Alphaproteobacteria bacterium 41-28]
MSVSICSIYHKTPSPALRATSPTRGEVKQAALKSPLPLWERSPEGRVRGYNSKLKKFNKNFLMPFCYRYVAKIVLVERKDIPYMILISAGNTSLYLRWFIIRAQRPDVGSSDPRGR